MTLLIKMMIVDEDYDMLWMGHILWLLRSIAPGRGRVLCQSCS